MRLTMRFVRGESVLKAVYRLAETWYLATFRRQQLINWLQSRQSFGMIKILDNWQLLIVRHAKILIFVSKFSQAREPTRRCLLWFGCKPLSTPNSIWMLFVGMFGWRLRWHCIDTEFARLWFTPIERRNAKTIFEFEAFAIHRESWKQRTSGW